MGSLTRRARRQGEGATFEVVRPREERISQAPQRLRAARGRPITEAGGVRLCPHSEAVLRKQPTSSAGMKSTRRRDLTCFVRPFTWSHEQPQGRSRYQRGMQVRCDRSASVRARSASSGAVTSPKLVSLMSAYMSEAGERLGAVIDRRFRIEKLLGAGGMGAVYVAAATNGHRYALKLLLHDRLATNSQMVARFIREARLAASIEAPNVVKTYECAVDAATGAPFIVMELLDGFDVESLVERVGPIDPAAAVRIILQAAQGLHVAHAAGIVHRDIKPANLFVHRRSASGPRGRATVVKVCDFGIAKAIVADNESLTVTGTPLGTPLYLSPEQMRSAKHVDSRTDVWSLGMSLWTMLAGRSAFAGATTLAELFVGICTQDVPWLQDSAPWVDPALARIVHGTLLRDLQHRCPDLPALIEALTPFAGATEKLFEEELVGTSDLTRRQAAIKTHRVGTWNESVPPPGDRDAAPDPALKSLVGTTLGGRYRLDRLLGAGGMGAVYASTNASGEDVAVKVVLGDPERQRPELLRRFVREARSTMAIDSPNVVRVVDVDTDPQRGFPFIVMELLSGVDLDKLIRENGAIDPGVAAKLFIQACTGLGAAHSRGILHRDVKPANVFLHQHADGRVQVKICDFGIAKQLNPDDSQGVVSTELTRTGGVLGSPMYMSPEQARSAKHIDATSDVWSLGAALYECLSGRRVWEGHTSVGDLIIAICTKEVPLLQEVAPWIDAELAEVVHKALQREASARHATMQAFASALAPFASVNPLTTAELVPVPAPVRARPGRISTTAGGISSVGAASLGSTGVPLPSSGSRRGLFIGLAAAAAVAGVVAAVSLNRFGEPTTAASQQPPVEEVRKPEKAAIAQASTVRVRVPVRVTPAESEVLVDGKAAATFTNGVLTLEGEPGDSFEVVAKIGTKSVSKQVFIGKDAKPSVSAIEVPAEPKVVLTTKPTTAKTVTKPSASAAPTGTQPEKPPPPPPATASTPIGASTF